MICCITGKNSPLPAENLIMQRACREQGPLRIVYDAGIDLAHYGEVDQLAPAGSMAEFVEYVRRQSREEAETKLAPLYAAARRQNLSIELHVVYGREGIEALLRQWRQHGPLLILGTN